MNLEEALVELTKKPRPMLAATGQSVPALQYTVHTHAALRWLCDRYNDGTLQVIGYDSEAVRRKKHMATYDKRRQGYKLEGQMQLKEFVKNTGIAYKTAKRMAIEADALYKPSSYYLYVDIMKFNDYWQDAKVKSQHNDHYVDLGTASNMLGLLPMETKRLCESGEIIRRNYDPNVRLYYISVNSINDYLKRKGEQNGEDNSING